MLFSHSFATIVLCALTLPVSNALPVPSTSDYTTHVSSSDSSPIGADAYIPNASSNANNSGTPADHTSYDCPSSSVPPDSHTPSNTASDNSATVENLTAGTSFPCSPASRKPATVVLDGQKLMNIKCRVKSGELGLQSELNGLLSQADSWMTQGPWSVVNNLKSVPNGNSHDYASQAPYWWPNNWEDPDSGDVCPYVQRDGVFNPETEQYTSKADRLSMFEASYTLSLAWYHSDNSSYRVHAADILKTWFINEATAMNPNLAHSQLIPCANDGRSIGIIDFSQMYTDVLDAVSILSLDYDDSWSQNDEAVFRQWNSDYLTWLTQSDFGKAELSAQNNHATFALLQVAGIASYVGQTDLARTTVESTKSLIDSYISQDGTQPLELERTRSWHYSIFNLVAYTRLADIGALLNVDLWDYYGPDGQSIKGAIDFLIPYATGSQVWPYEELNFLQYAASDVINAAADHNDHYAQSALPDIAYSPIGNQWSLRPSAEQLDNIVTT
ncbi:hypothetical protein L198_06338 [Cryptococcus wingfieldii CBS 7118]|uniref:Alginate lyase domain-containing protein n=1 Tax=Cryptococcus wingfieldii CBS 7118 TaxID=1295528 RepID=A0A1E3IM27_9TREE|nr:hypothetical protein L198_06338 [Cryptococcus wingfieldii CBS 7118]ODN89650.1 hypothetical protein L198_06338 [Cryptococcus wingfieldii CBS 7118]